ncbi:MAG: Rod shape-determining protein [Parcubacteria group bacterium GW2011_GWE2_38_18]|nr:MAG: Rod shape-determining protein [Parcubacteria group bacterium GW2011_GWE2_38_18]
MDWIMLSSVLLLMAFGLAEIYSVSLGRGADLLNFKKQLLFIAVGVILMLIFAFSDYHNLRSYSVYLYIFGIMSLLAVLFFGKVINGTKGWFSIFGFGIQPVEFIKLALIIFLARYFSGSSMRINQLRHFVITGGATLILFVLILFQPDFGSAMLLFALWFSIIIFTGPEKKYLFAIFLIIALLAGGAWSFYLKDYQKQRVLTFFNPSFDPLDQGYNVAQAIIAVGSGGLVGRGIGFGSQSQLKFLPESQTDFIFAVVAEELGFLGVGLVMLFFAVFFYRCIVSLKKVNNDFGIFFILGVVSLIFIEMFINIAMNMGLLPVVGISLPFISYGGSAIIINLILVGIIQSIIIRSKTIY